LHLIDDVSKAWARATWTPTPSAFDSASFGYIPGRQREMAVLLQRIARYRVHHRGFGCLQVYWDLTNAFASVDPPLLDRAIDSAISDAESSWFLKQRHRRAFVVLKDHDNNILAARMQQGDRQGDVPAAQKYILAVDPLTNEFNRCTLSALEEQYLFFVHPVTQQLHTATIVRYADDIAKTGIVLRPQDAISKLTEWNNTFDEYLASARLAQNLGKQQVVAHWTGQHSRDPNWTFSRLLQDKGGTPCNQAKHLGLIQELSGFQQDISSRISAMNVSWSRFKGFWTYVGIPQKIKILAFKAICQTTLLAGLQVCIPTNTALLQLEQTIVKKLRLLLLGAATDWPEQHHPIRHSSDSVREVAHVYTCQSLLQVGRLRLLRSILLQPTALATLWSALFGTSAAFDDPQICRGRPTATANPWIKLYWQDVQDLAKLFPALHEHLGQGFFTVAASPYFAPRYFKKLLTFKSTIPTPQPRGTNRAIPHWRNDWGQAIIANHCYWCDALFSSRQSAIQHVRISQRSGQCPTRATRHPYVLQLPRILRCRICSDDFRDYDCLILHVLEHYLVSSSDSSDSTSTASDSSD
jgi:hypothetical protein